MSSIDSHMQHLRSILRDKPLNYVGSAERCLAEITSKKTTDALVGLLEMFDDSAPDDIMFSIVHSVETWNDTEYSAALLNSVEHLWYHSPRWAQILHIRILNSASISETYLHMARSAGGIKGRLVRAIYESVKSGWPKLSEKVDQALLRLDGERPRDASNTSETPS